MKIYLAGGLSCDWQDRVPGNHEWLDPRSWQDDDPAVYTARDLAAIRECDVLLAYMSSANPSGFGMSLEIGFAHALGRPILFVDHIGGDWRSRYFGMHRVVADHVFASFDEAADFLAQWDRSGEASETRSGSTEGESPVPPTGGMRPNPLYLRTIP